MGFGTVPAILRRRKELRVIKSTCPKCGHPKAWSHTKRDYFKCTRCGHEFRV